MTNPVLLPPARAVQSDKPRLINFGGQLTPFMGGPVQTLLRLGTRWALDFTVPRMPAEPNGRIWAARLCAGLLSGVLFPFGQDGFDTGDPGAPVVDGGDQTGRLLALRGFRPGYVAREGQFFSIVTAARRYLYQVQADTVASAAGAMDLPILPMLRVSPGDGDQCEFAQPYIQGSLSGNEANWTRPGAPFYDFGTISISEDE